MSRPSNNNVGDRWKMAALKSQKLNKDKLNCDRTLDLG